MRYACAFLSYLPTPLLTHSIPLRYIIIGMNKNDIILRIGQIRSRAGLSARELSHRIELNDGYINRLESKKDFLPSLEVLLRIIEACDCTPAEFFYHDIAAYKQDSELIDMFKGLDAASKTLVKDLILKIKK